MPKQQLNITDFTGGLNCYSDARDIKENQFAQNWNASLDKYGVVRYTGAGTKHITNHPHTNTNFVPGGGLFSFSQDILPNIIVDSGNFDISHEEGTAQGYSTTSGVGNTPGITLAATPTYVTSSNHEDDDYYNNMIISIVDGPGKGQSRLITDYVGSSRVATVAAFGNSDIAGDITAIDGTSVQTKNVALLRVYNLGPAGEEYLSNSKLIVSSNNKTGIITFSLTEANSIDPSAETTTGPDADRYGAHAAATILINDKSATTVASNIVSAINNFADISSTTNFTASAVSDGSANTIVKIVDDNAGSDAGSNCYMEYKTSSNPSSTIDIFQPFQEKFSQGSIASTSGIAMLRCSGHTVNVGEYITITGADSDYNTTFKVIWVDSDDIYVESTGGDSSDVTDVEFNTVPTSASKYVIYNIKSSSNRWSIDGGDDSYDCRKLISNKPDDDLDVAVIGQSAESEGKFLSSTVEVTSAYTAQDLGYLQLPVQTLYPGATYKLSFDLYYFALWQMFTDDDILPGILIYSPTAGDGTKDGVLMGDNKWVISDEPVSSGNEVSLFTNEVVNGDMKGITDTGINVNEGSGEAVSTGSVTVTVDGTAAASNALGKIFTTSAGLPIGICTAVNSTTEIVFGRGIDTALADDADLYTLDGWSVEGSDMVAITLPNTTMETYDGTTATATANRSKTFSHGQEITDGGPDGSHTLIIQSNEGIPNSSYLYQDLELDGNCYYHLYIKYAPGLMPGHELKYNIYNKETSTSLSNGWQITSSNGHLYRFPPNDGSYEEECYYRHINQGINQNDDNFNFQYVTFFVPPRDTERDAVTVSIRFTTSAGLSYDMVSMGISIVSVKKSFTDIVTMVNQKGSGNLPIRFDDGYNPITEERKTQNSSITESVSRFEYSFTVPQNFQKKSDWVIRLYGGKFGYTTINATATTHHSRYSQVQSVGFKNINLEATDIDTGEIKKNIILLNDNTSISSKIYAYYEEFGYWDTDFAEFTSTNADPYYTYVNGLLQISDTNFNNDSPLLHYFHYDRIIDNSEIASGWINTNNVLDFIGTVIGSNLLSDTERQREIAPYPIHADIWADHTMVPQNMAADGGDFGRCEYNDSDAHNYTGDGGNHMKPWHYKWFEADKIDNFEDYIEGLGTIPQTNPVKWVSGLATGGGHKYFKYTGNNPIQSGTDQYANTRTENHSDLVNEALQDEHMDLVASKMWLPGGMSSEDESTNPTSVGRGDSEGDFDYGWGIEPNNFHCINNPIYLPIRGNEGDNENSPTSMITMLKYGDEGYQGSAPLYLSSMSFTLHVDFNTILRLKQGANTYHYTRDLPLPQIKIQLYKYDVQSIGITEIKKTFTSQALENCSDIINSEHDSKQMPNFSSPQSFAQFAPAGSNEQAGIRVQWSDDNFPITFEYGDEGLGFIGHLEYDYEFSFTPYEDDEGNLITGLSTDDNIMMKISIEEDPLHSSYDSLVGRVGTQISRYKNIGQSFGYLFSDWKINFRQEEFNPDDVLGGNTGPNEVYVNLDFDSILQTELEEGDDEDSTTLEGTGWAERVFSLASTTVNIFDEESPIRISDFIFGEEDVIQATEAPAMNLTIGKDLMRNPLVKKVKIYMKDNTHDIWYLQAFVDTETGIAKSSTSGIEYENLLGSQNENYFWTIQRKDLSTFNEIDSYESESLVKQEDAKSLGTLTCQYKTAVHVNNRLYVGNIKQGGKTYGDRMLKTPVGKYNVFPASNYIDVAIQDGDEITGLAYYKDRLLQFKRRTVFVINISGDYEYLEDTFDNIGINKQCQITETPYGVVWVNANGCFLYDGKKMVNLIDNKIGTENFQSNPIGSSNNFWTIEETDIPAIGYIRTTKKLIIARNTGPSTVGGTDSEAINTAITEGFQYDFQSQGWTFLYKKITATPESSDAASVGYLSNFTNNKDGDIIYYAVDAPDDTLGLNDIYKWTDDSTTSNASSGVMDNFILRTKDFDFGTPGGRKKIYKVYVTFKSTNGGSAAHSNIKVHYATNGSSSFTEFSNNSTNYSTTNGLTDGASSTGWITAELKPSSSINNIYSFAIRFQGGGTNIADGFEINDYTIVYRIKNVK